MRILSPAPLSLNALTLTALIFSAAAAFPAAAQDEDEAPIIVTGAVERKERIQSFVGALTPAPAGGQLARFETPICPAVLGMPEARKVAVEKRIRTVAAAIGMDVADAAKCTPNLLVLVTRDKADFMKALRKDHRDFFSGLTPTQIGRIQKQPGSAAAWQVELLLDSDGRPILRDEDGAMNAPTNAASVTSPSRLRTAQRPSIMAAAVVVEADALHGLSTTQLADYAAMRSFARADPARLAADAPDTILRVIDAPAGSAQPVTLTEWDFAFLKALQSSPKNLLAATQRVAIAQEVEKELEAGPESGPTPRS